MIIFQKGAFVSEPAILVRRRHRSSQIWTMEKFENKIIDMRDMYEERKRLGVPIMVDDSDESESVCVVALHDFLLLCTYHSPWVNVLRIIPEYSNMRLTLLKVDHKLLN